MEYKLELKPFVKKEGWKYKIIQITDIAVHTTQTRPTASIGNKIALAFKKNAPGRIYGLMDKDKAAASPSERKAALVEAMKHDPSFLEMVQESERNGYKVLLELPEEIPVIFGADTVEFIASVNGKRILRGLAKNN